MTRTDSTDAAPSACRLRPRAPRDDAWVAESIASVWGAVDVVSRGRVHRADQLPGLVGERDGERVGLLTYHVQDGALEVVTIQSLAPRTGVGSSLLDGAVRVARDAGCHRIWLVTTNDNTGACAFYSARGMRVRAVHAGALEVSRGLKPSIPTRAEDGTPLEDEIEFEQWLGAEPPVPALSGAALREHREALVRRHMQAENVHDFDDVIATFAHPRYELVGTGRVHDGEEEVRAYFQQSRGAFPDQRNELHALHHADDAVLAEFDLLGTHLGPLGDLAPTGRAFRVRMAALFVFEGADLVCERVYFDSGSILRQLERP